MLDSGIFGGYVACPRDSGQVFYPGQTPVVGAPFNNNRWADGSGVSYDAAGNQLALGSGRIFQYDAENRQQNANINLYPTVYTYDGDGRRVSKVSCPQNTVVASCGTGTSGAVVTYFAYDAFGRLASEYGGPANPNIGTTI